MMVTYHLNNYELPVWKQIHSLDWICDVKQTSQIESPRRYMFRLCRKINNISKFTAFCYRALNAK